MIYRAVSYGVTDEGRIDLDSLELTDAVKATLHLLATPASVTAPNGLYNVGTGTARTFADLAKAVFAALELEPRLIFIPMPEDLRDQYQYFTQAQVAKLVHAQYATVTHPNMLALTDRLYEHLPKGLDAVAFSNSGSESVEAAIRLGRRWLYGAAQAFT